MQALFAGTGLPDQPWHMLAGAVEVIVAKSDLAIAFSQQRGVPA